MNSFRDFQDILTDLDDGKVHEELTRKLRDVVVACAESNQPGALTLKISIRPDGRQFVVNAKVTPTIPAVKPSMTMFFADAEGDLIKEDPKQLPLRRVVERAANQPVRNIDADAHKDL